MTVSHPIWLHCREVVERMADLLGDGDLAEDDVIRLEQHLLVCPPCTAHLAQLRATVALVAETDGEPIDPAAALAAFRRWKAGR